MKIYFTLLLLIVCGSIECLKLYPFKAYMKDVANNMEDTSNKKILVSIF